MSYYEWGKFISGLGAIAFGLGLMFLVNTLIKKVFNKLFSNPSKELLLKNYLFWVDIVEGVDSVEKFKKRLKKIKKKIVYKGDFNRFYLSAEEAGAFSDKFEAITIAEVLKSETYPLFLLQRLAHITLYEMQDIKNISKNSYMAFTTVKDIIVSFMINKDGAIIYPKDYPKDNPFRFGYEIFTNKNGLKGVYDIEADKLLLACIYKVIKAFANIVEVTQDEKTYEIYNLSTMQQLDTIDVKTHPNIKTEYKALIDLSKIELEDYMKLYDIPKSIEDLIYMGLYDAKVLVMDVPSGYEEIIKDPNMGTICIEYPVTANVFDMSMELPVMFEKKDGDFVTLGVAFKYLILEKEYREKLTLKPKQENKSIKEFRDLLKRGNLPDDDRVVPNWLKIKNEQFDDVDFTNNSIDAIIQLTKDEFSELIDEKNTGLLITYFSTLNEKELNKFYDYLDSLDAQHIRKQIQETLSNIEEDEITNEQKAKATLEMPLVIQYAKYISKKIEKYKEFRQKDYFKNEDGVKVLKSEVMLSDIVWGKMSEIPILFEQVIDSFKDFYDENSDEHQEILEHLAVRFGQLIVVLNNLIAKTQNRDSSLNWFVGLMSDKGLIGDFEISVSKTKTLTSDQKLIKFHTLTFLAIVQENEDNYLENLINVTNTMFEWYPINREACEYVMVEMMKSVAIKEVNKDNANAFLEFFEKLPRLYEVLDYRKIAQLKEIIKHTIATYKPQENKIFDEEGVKSKLILLNYLVDMEDLYFSETEKQDKL